MKLQKKGTMLKMRKNLLSAVFVLAVLMVLSLVFAIPSGAITEDAQNRYFDALWEDQYEFDEEAKKPEPIAVLASAVFSDILPAANVNPLENDLFAPGSTPVEGNFTENGYRDDTIIVEMDKQRMFDSDVYIAYVKVATPSQVRTAINSGDLGRAENLLNSVAEHDAEWYFLMGSLCYRKGWMDEAANHYTRAASMDPGNAEYRQALQFMRSGGQAYRYQGPGRASTMSGCDCCTNLLIADCCCECMGGDLISCC